MKALTIYDESHEPLLRVGQDEMGLSVISGDPKMIQNLGLDKMRDLKEIADFINSPGAGLQAVFDEDDQKDEDNKDMDDRLGPALEMIKDLMGRVSERKKQEHSMEQNKKPEKEMLETTDSEVVYDPNEKIYVSLDGDNIGNAVARAEEKDDEQTLAEISNRINAGQDVLRNWAMLNNGQVIEAGGDEGLVKVPAAAKKEIENLRSQYLQAVGNTCTVGVGKKISESTKARMLGKLTGKNKVVTFSDSTIKELDLKMKDRDETETNKINTAMRPEEGEKTQEPFTTNQEAPQAEQQAPEQEASQPAPQATEEAPAQPETDEKNEQPVQKAQLSPGLLKAAGTREEQAPKSVTGNSYYDHEIDNDDYSSHDDPEFAKRFAYVAKHGGQ